MVFLSTIITAAEAAGNAGIGAAPPPPPQGMMNRTLISPKSCADAAAYVDPCLVACYQLVEVNTVANDTVRMSTPPDGTAPNPNNGSTCVCIPDDGTLDSTGERVDGVIDGYDAIVVPGYQNHTVSISLDLKGLGDCKITFEVITGSGILGVCPERGCSAPDPAPASSGLSTGATVGIVVAVIAGIFACAFFVMPRLRRRAAYASV